MSVAEILKKLHELVVRGKRDRVMAKDENPRMFEDYGKHWINMYITDEFESSKEIVMGAFGIDKSTTRGKEYMATKDELDKLIQAYRSSEGVTDQQATKAIDAMLYALRSADGDYNEVGQYANSIGEAITNMITGDNLSKPILDIIKETNQRTRDGAGTEQWDITKSLTTPTQTPAYVDKALVESGTLPKDELKKFADLKEQARIKAKDDEVTRAPLGTTDLGGDPFGMDLSPEERAYSGLTRKEIAAGLPLAALGGSSPYARRTYQDLLNPLAQDNGVFTFLNTAGLTPRVALPGQPDVTNEALSFRAFLAQGPQSMAKNINQGLTELEEAKRLAFEDNQRFYTDPTYATDLQKTLYTQFVDSPGNELALRQALARRAYPGELGDVISTTLAKSFFATQATDPYRLTQPGFYKNAFQNYLPTTVANNFFSGSASDNKKAVQEATSKITEDDENKTEIKANQDQFTDEKLEVKSTSKNALATALAKSKGGSPGSLYLDQLSGGKGIGGGPSSSALLSPKPTYTDIGGDPFSDLMDANDAKIDSSGAVSPSGAYGKALSKFGGKLFPGANTNNLPEGAIPAPEGTPGGGFIDPITYNMDPQAFQQFQEQQRKNLTPRFDAQGNIIAYDNLPEGQRVITDPVTRQTRIAPALPVSDIPPSPPGFDVPIGTTSVEPTPKYTEKSYNPITKPYTQDIGGDPFAYMEDLALANQGMGSAPTMGAPQMGGQWNMGKTSADQWIEPGVADMPVDVAPRRTPSGESEMIQERMADRQAGPLMPGEKGYTTGGIVSLGNQLGANDNIGFGGRTWVNPETASSMINFPGPVSAADIQDVQRRGITNPSVSPRSTFENYNPYMLGADQPAPGVGQTEMFNERYIDRPPGPVGQSGYTINDPRTLDKGSLVPRVNELYGEIGRGVEGEAWGGVLGDNYPTRVIGNTGKILTTQIPTPFGIGGGDLNPINASIRMGEDIIRGMQYRDAINPNLDKYSSWNPEGTPIGNNDSYNWLDPSYVGNTVDVAPSNAGYVFYDNMSPQIANNYDIDDFKRRANLFSSFVR